MTSRRKQPFAWILVLAGVVVVNACVANRMYREQSIVEFPGYTLSFLEFDDQGEVWSHRQFIELQDRIRRANQARDGAVIVLFAHGWNNNASEKNEVKGTLAGFKKTLEGLAADIHLKSPGRSVIGVYLGWRGQSLQGPLKYLTFFSRQRAASRVAGVQSIVVVGQIIQDAKENPSSDLIVIGHSFGGQIIERLTQQGLASGLFFIQDEEMPAFEDLTVLINPASPAVNAKQVVDLLKWQRLSLEKRAEDGRRWEVPIVVSITAEEDFATRVGYRVGSLMGLMTNRFRDYGPEMCSPITNQRPLYTRTAGHTPMLHSHKVKVRPLSPGSPAFLRTEDGFVVEGDGVAIEVSKRPKAYNDTPYWIMRVPEEIMADHGDNWNPNLVALVKGLLTVTGAFAKDAELQIVRRSVLDPVFFWPRTAGTAWLVDRSRQIFGLVDGQEKEVRVGCLPEEIDLANVIGQACDDATFVLVHWDDDPGDPDKRLTEVLELGLAPGGFHLVDRTKIRSEEPFLKAGIDRLNQRVFLATGEKIVVAEFGGKMVRPQLVAELNFGEDPAAMALDHRSDRLYALMKEKGVVVEFELDGSSEKNQVVLRGLEKPTTMAVDPKTGEVFIVEAGSGTVSRWIRADGILREKKPVLHNSDFVEPTFFEVAEDGSLWIGDPAADRLYHYQRSGELIQRHG